MERTVIDLPCSFTPLVSDWIINVRGKSAGDGVTGTGQVAYGAQPRWEAQLNIAGFRRDQVLAWRAIRAKMRGRLNVLRVCVCDMHRASWAELGLTYYRDGIPHDDETLHEDDAGYAQDPVIVVVDAVEAGAEEITVDASSVNNALQPGQWFSIDDWPYQVTGMWEADDDLTTFSFEPPLRRAVPANSEITLRATALMVFVEDLEGRMPLDLGKRGTATLNLIEWTGSART